MWYTSFNMKITVQEKIAELEGRIERLEKLHFSGRNPYVVGNACVRQVHLSDDADWKRIWSHFDRLFRKVFPR